VTAPALITATIITRNEEERIAGAITSLACCDEVVVIDSESTDRTREIAAAHGARVVIRPWGGYSAQKNFAAEVAAFDWILSIDADERLSAELAAEITAWKSNPTGYGGSMPRRAFYLGRWIRHSGWYPDRKVRLYNRTNARWSGQIHEALETAGPPTPFAADLLHIPYRDWSEHIQRIDRYTRLAAASAKAAGKTGSYARLALAPALSFLKSYVLRAGFLDGWRGAAIAYASARYVFLRELRILR
jgi:glycosyltransferase involved in cell wall biosynthesis